MGAGPSRQTLNRAALKRLRKLQADFNALAPADGRAVYLAANRSRYGEVVFPDGTVASVTVIRASNGEAWMQLIVWPAGQSVAGVKYGGQGDLDFVKMFLT